MILIVQPTLLYLLEAEEEKEEEPVYTRPTAMRYDSISKFLQCTVHVIATCVFGVCVCMCDFVKKFLLHV